MKIRSFHHGKSQVADENEVKETTRKEDCCKRMRWKQESTEISDEEIRVRVDRKTRIRRKRTMHVGTTSMLVNEFEPPTLIISVILIFNFNSTYTKESVPNFYSVLEIIHRNHSLLSKKTKINHKIPGNNP